MIDLYFAPTPNGMKIKLFMEESGIEHKIIPIDLKKGDQFKPEFLAISPNNKIPAIVDHQPSSGMEKLHVFESGAILLYLSNKKADSCRQASGREKRRCNGSSGRQADWRPWQANSSTSPYMRIRKCPML